MVAVVGAVLASAIAAGANGPVVGYPLLFELVVGIPFGVYALFQDIYLIGKPDPPVRVPLPEARVVRDD